MNAFERYIASRERSFTPDAVKTKDFLIALHAHTGKPIAELIRDILNQVASQTTERRSA